MSSTTDQRTTTDDRPTTTDVRQQLEHTTNKRSRSSFIFREQDLFFFEALRCHQRPTNDNRRTSAFGVYDL